MLTRNAVLVLAFLSPFVAALAFHLYSAFVRGHAYPVNVYAAIVVMFAGSVAVAIAAANWATGRLDTVDAALQAVPGLAMLIIARWFVYPGQNELSVPAMWVTSAMLLVPLWVQLRRDSKRAKRHQGNSSRA